MTVESVPVLIDLWTIYRQGKFSMIPFPKPDVEQFFQTYLIRAFGVSADESRLVFTSTLSGKFNLWAMDLNEATVYPYPLTYNDQVSSFIKLDPEGRHILTAFDRDGNENYQFHALRWNGGHPLPLFEGRTRIPSITLFICRRTAKGCITPPPRIIRPF